MDFTRFDSVSTRYRAYCIANGAKTPQEMMGRDKNNYPYLAWNNAKLTEWKKQAGKDEWGKMTAEDHDLYDHWLIAQVICGL